MVTITEDKVREALALIVKHRKEKALNWAVNYAREGLAMSGEALRVQCLYVLGNITHWRGDVAKDVRQTLKEFTK